MTVTIDGREITVPEDTTIWQAAKQLGIDIPVLCHDERYDPVGVCRMCVVDVGGRVFAASCVRACEDELEVKTSTPGARPQPRERSPRLLLSDQPELEEDPKETTTGDNELLALARRYGATRDEIIPVGAGRGTDAVQPRDRREPRRLHPVRPLRTGL